MDWYYQVAVMFLLGYMILSNIIAMEFYNNLNYYIVL
jgi:hypothetical protein